MRTIPSHGIAGAGLAWNVSLIAVTLVRFVQLYWLTGIAPYGDVTAKSFFAAAVAAAAAVLARVALGPTVLQAVIGSTAALAVYVVVVALGLA
ncbi:MAG: hypothetical protein J2P17_32340, partial [Mycobacterium sp.]|nr:hypothetical protein [Mycobacterium sp.]